RCVVTFDIPNAGQRFPMIFLRWSAGPTLPLAAPILINSSRSELFATLARVSRHSPHSNRQGLPETLKVTPSIRARERSETRPDKEGEHLAATPRGAGGGNKTSASRDHGW